MRYKNKIGAIITPLVVALGVVVGIYIGRGSVESVQQEAAAITYQKIKEFIPKTKLAQTLSLIESKYVETVDVDTLSEEFIAKILKKLDPHSAFIPAKDYDDSQENLTGEFYGIGVVFNMATDTAIIQNVISAGPAEKVGIVAGDRIMVVSDSVVAGVKFDQNKMVKMLKGEGGTTVTVKIERVGVKDLMSFDIVRDKIPIKSIDAFFMVSEDVGYIKLLQFARTTHSEFVQAVEKLREQGMKKLIFDLGNNPGGYLDQAILIANEFLPVGKLIVYTEGRNSKMAEQYSDGRGRFTTQDLVVMIDEGSASSSEIVAGALQDNDRGILVGRRSFGKGLVQEQIPYKDGSAINLTIARYHTPTGRCIQRPYDKGYDEYYKDLYQRYSSKELVSADSIHFADSLKYTTPKGKIVYGGGGIMPDVFVPLDTTALSRDVRAIILDNTLFSYSLRYTDSNRKELVTLSTLELLDGYFNDKKQEELYRGFIKFAKSRKHNLSLSKSDKRFVLDYLMAYIARNSSVSDNGFYFYFNRNNDIFKQALMVASDNQEQSSSQIITKE